MKLHRAAVAGARIRALPLASFAATGLGILCATHGLPAQSAQSRRVDQIFAEWNTPTSPGCAVGVVQNGRFLYKRGYGMANLDYDVPNSPEMVYYVGSVSKQFAAASIALLSLQGRISLDDDIRKYIPEMPDYGARITIRHLVHHTSGIRDIYVLMALAGKRLEDVFTDADALELIARQRELSFAPGAEYSYSNSGYFLLAQIIKRVTGMSLRDYADQQIFQPLGMTRTHFHDDPGHVMKRRAVSYRSDGRGGFAIADLQNFDKIGAGGLYSTIEDLARWDENYYTHRVGGEAFQRLIHTRGVLNNGDSLEYAFGNQIGTYRGLRTVAHSGSMMGFKANIIRFPDQHFSVIETCNLASINPSALGNAVAEVYLEGKMGPKPQPRRRDTAASSGDASAVALSDADLAALEGEYRSDELEVTYRVVRKDGQLAIDARNVSFSNTPLARTGTDTFRAIDGFVVTFVRANAGAPASGFTVGAARASGVRFTRVNR
jgi:CubicO group peptidase (beta-lactamase class C family)